MTACGAAHQQAASVAGATVIVGRVVFHAVRSAAVETGAAAPCSHLSMRSDLGCIDGIVVNLRLTQVPQSPPQTWLKSPLRHSPSAISLAGEAIAGGGRVSDEMLLVFLSLYILS